MKDKKTETVNDDYFIPKKYIDSCEFDENSIENQNNPHNKELNKIKEEFRIEEKHNILHDIPIIKNKKKEKLKIKFSLINEVNKTNGNSELFTKKENIEINKNRENKKETNLDIIYKLGTENDKKKEILLNNEKINNIETKDLSNSITFNEIIEDDQKNLKIIKLNEPNKNKEIIVTKKPNLFEFIEDENIEETNKKPIERKSKTNKKKEIAKSKNNITKNSNDDKLKISSVKNKLSFDD